MPFAGFTEDDVGTIAVTLECIPKTGKQTFILSSLPNWKGPKTQWLASKSCTNGFIRGARIHDLGDQGEPRE